MNLLFAILIKVLAWIAGIFGAMLGFNSVKDYYHTGVTTPSSYTVLRKFTMQIVLQAIMSGALLALWSIFK